MMSSTTADDHRRVRAAAAWASAQIVHDDAGAAAGQFGGLGPADPSGTTGDNDDVAVKSNLPAHEVSSLKIGFP